MQELRATLFMNTNSTSSASRPHGQSDTTLRRLRRLRWPLWLQVAAVFFWTLGLPATRAAYVPDSTGQPAWDGNGDEPPKDRTSEIAITTFFPTGTKTTLALTKTIPIAMAMA